MRDFAAMAMVCVLVMFAAAGDVAAQEHDHSKMNMSPRAGWQLMQDGAMLVEFNHQGSPRGGQELVAPNWWMLMADRKTARGTLTLSGMFSLDAATAGNDGYRELFQTGEALHGQPIVDRQHPHDLFMQAEATWTTTFATSIGLVLSGAAAGAPALGPVPFMHRASALDNPMAPLSHHTFDSTHVSFGVVTAGVSRGRWMAEASVFNGREPDERRWDFDFAPLDSVSGRVSFAPNGDWAFQVSTGHLVHPEQLEAGNIQRSTASATWTRTSRENGEGTTGATSLTSITGGYGRNDTDHGARQAFFLEGAHGAAPNTVYGRVEAVQLEAAATGTPVFALTIGGVRDVLNRSGIRGGFGGGLTLHATPAVLEAAYGRYPVSFQVFFRLRRATRMMNMPRIQ